MPRTGRAGAAASAHARPIGVVRQFLRYAVVGVLNAAVHFAVVAVLVTGLDGRAGWTQVQANALAFAVANLFSFWANGRYTFGRGHGVRRYGRFLVVSLAGLLLTLAISALGQSLQWHFALTVAVLLVLLPMVGFAANRHWTWRAA